MTGDKDWERCEPDDPRRCQATNGMKGSQCSYKATDGNKFCPRHMAGTAKRQNAEIANGFRLGTYFAERSKDFASSSELKNLRGELGIIRKMIEEVTSNCKDFNTMIAYSSKISELIRDSQSLVRSIHHMDERLGMMMDKDRVMQIGQNIVEIIAEYIKDPVILEKIGERIGDLFLESSTP